MLLDDIQGVILKGRNPNVFTNIADLLDWVDLDWRISAKQYETDYDTNGIAADNNFKGKRLLLSGTIDSIDKDVLDSAFLCCVPPGSEFVPS